MKKQSVQDIRRLRARDIMIPSVLTVRDNMSVQDAAHFLIEHEISGAPVVDGYDNTVGVFSLTDIAREKAEQGETASNRFFRNFYAEGWEDELEPEEMEQLAMGGESRLVRDAMTPAIYTVSEQASVSEIAAAMIEGRVHRLFVTDEDCLTGIVTTLDILKLLRE